MYLFISQQQKKMAISCWWYNTELKVRVSIEYNPEILPNLMEWKTLGSGDYALGLEPANGSVFGRQYHHDNNSLPILHPFEKRTIELKIEILDGDEDYKKFKALIKEMLSDGSRIGN